MSSSITGMMKTMSGYIPSIPTKVKNVGVATAQGFLLGIKDYAEQAFVALSITVLHTAYPTILFRAIPLAYIVGYGDTSKDKINQTAQKFACAALAVELATSVLFPVSVTGRFIVQGAVVVASITGNAAAMRNGCVAIKAGTKKDSLEDGVRQIVKGAIEVIMGLYGAQQTLKVISNFYRYEASPTAPSTDEPAAATDAEPTDANPTLGEELAEPKPKYGYPGQMPWDLPDGEYPSGHDHRMPGRGHGHRRFHHRMGEGQAGEGRMKAFCAMFNRATCRKQPAAPAAPEPKTDFPSADDLRYGW